MSHSVVTVTESTLNDRLLLIVGEDGTVTPDRDTVDAYLSARDGPTDIQLMHINKTDGENIEVSVENLTYLHSRDVDGDTSEEMDEVARNLKNFQLDHDYTPLTSPRRGSPMLDEEPEEVSEEDIAQTLEIFKGNDPLAEAEAKQEKQIKVVKTPVKIVKKAPNVVQRNRARVIATSTPSKTTKPKPKQTVVKPDDEDDYEDDDYFDEDESEDDEDDSDFEVETTKVKTPRRVSRTRTKSQSLETPKKIKTKTPPKPKEPEQSKLIEKLPEPPPVEKTVEKKPKKEKKAPKPIPDDFALFSTPDIIRRVGGKEPTTPNQIVSPTTPEAGSPPKPAKITPENRTKSNSERSSMMRSSRFSAETKLQSNHARGSDNKKDRRTSLDLKRSSLDDKIVRTDKISNELNIPPSDQVVIQSITETETSSNSNDESTTLEPMPSAEDIRAIILNENTKSYTTDLVIPDPPEQNNLDQNNMNLDTGGLELDQSLLDNINSDLISEDILMQVAQSLVDNTDLQNVIDKSIVEGNLVLDPSLQQVMAQQENALNNQQVVSSSQMADSSSSNNETNKGTQIVRPSGRIVVIPPIERPTTRSRNKRKQVEEVEVPKQPVKAVHKPLDEEHVSGNELESEEDSDEEKSEDDPDKLWCICNQPHNNRFMICCDTCEEWYHGKCVNVTKAMGQLMEQEGREWICLFCKDPSLKRPQAAARRIRKASRASSDSSGSQQKSASSTSLTEMTSTSSSSVLACIVCGNPSRKNSVYCSEACILKHAQGVEKVVVFERASGTILSDNRAPTAANLEKWLQEHPGYEVVRSATNKTTLNKTPGLPMSPKFKIVKSSNNEIVRKSHPLQRQQQRQQQQQLQQQQRKIIKNRQFPQKTLIKGHVPGLKIVSKQAALNQAKTKLAQTAQPSVTKTHLTTPVKVRTSQPQPRVSTPTTKDKPTVQKTPKSRHAEHTTPQPKKQENIRDNVKKTLFEQLTKRLNMVEDLKLTKEEVQNISNEIESQLFKCFGDTSQKYRNKYRSLIFNIKDVKNQTLWRRICEKKINPYQLVRLSPDDLASQELALWRERETKHQLDMIKKSELELLNCNRQCVFKTHKGEQVLEDGRPTDTVDSTEVIANLGADSTSAESTVESKTEQTKDKDKKSSSKHSKRDRDRDRKSSKEKSDGKDRSRREHRSSSRDKDKKKRSRSRDRDHSSRRSDKKRSRSRDRDRDRDKYKRSSHKSSRHKKENHSSTDKLDKRSKEILEQLVDKQIVPPLEDRLWKHVPQEDITPAVAESDSDHEPTSTVTIPTPPRNSESEDTSTANNNQPTVTETTPVATPTATPKEEKSNEVVTPKEVEEVSKSPPPPMDFIWKGTINMIDVAQISITAHEVSGDCRGLSEELPPTLDIVGRISPETVWDYIGKMKCSNSKMISLLRLNATNVEEKMPYIALYSYLSSRNRLGVVKSVNKAVKDFYILPLASQKPIPQALLPISGPGFEESRPALLLGIIVRDKKRRSLMDPLPPTQSKRIKVEIVPPTSAPTPRSYTPPPNRDPRLKVPYTPAPITALPKPVVEDEETEEAENEGETAMDAEVEGDDMDEPYSPEDSDPDSTPVFADNTTDTSSSHLNATDLSNLLTGSVKSSSFLDTGLSSQTFEPFTSKFDTIPGLDDPSTLPSSSIELQRKMAELDQRIAMQKAEIDNMSQDIVSTAKASDIGTSALANIALPSNLQQILDSIKTIGAVSSDSQDSQTSFVDTLVTPKAQSDLTIPLILPKLNSRNSGGITPVPPPKTEPYVPTYSPTNSTIPLNLPTKLKTKSITLAQTNETEKPSASSGGSVLSSLSEEDLIKKAAEMLGESPESTANPSAGKKTRDVDYSQSKFTPPPTKRTKFDSSQPPIPGLEDETET